MRPAQVMETERLRLRPWQENDLEPFADMGQDPAVMRHFPATLTKEDSARFIEKCRIKTVEHGFSLWPVELTESREFLGFVGLSVPSYTMPLPFDPCVEIGWRLKQSAWGKGYAPEAANAWLRFGFETLNLEEIVAFTVPANDPSQRVMKKIGMARDRNGDFLHPNLDPNHPMARHVLYRLAMAEWMSLSTG